MLYPQEKGIAAGIAEFEAKHAKEHDALQFKKDPWTKVAALLSNEFLVVKVGGQGRWGQRSAALTVLAHKGPPISCE
jgi:hypothetical protein